MNKVFDLGIKAGLFLLLFVAPLSLDIALVRYKLWVIEIATLWLITVWLLKKIYAGNLSLKKSFLDLPILAYGLLTVGFWLLATERTVAQDEFIRMLLCVGLFFVALNQTGNTTRKNYDFILKVWFASTFLICLYGLGQHFGFNIKFLRWDLSIPQCSRVMSTSGNPLFFAAYLVILFPLIFTTLIQQLEKKKKTAYDFGLIIFLTGLLVLVLINLFYTKCRGGWLGWGASVLLIGLFAFKRYEWLRKYSLVGATLFIFLIIGFGWKTRQVWLRPTDRLLIWRDSLAMVKEHPLLGVGPGRYHLEFRHSPELLKRIPRNKFIVNYAHNEFLEVLCETGIIGFGIFLWLYLTPFFTVWQGTTRQKNNSWAVLPWPVIGVLGSETGLLVHNFFGVNMRFIVSAAYLFFALGILANYTSQGSWQPLQKSRRIKIQFSPVWKVFLVAIVLVGFVFCCKQILKPYLAHRAVATEKSFFEEKSTSLELAKLQEATRQNLNDANAYYRLGWYFAKQKQFPQAIENFQKALQINPNLSGAYNNLGNIYYFTGRRDLAIKNYEKAIQLNPGLADAHFNLGYLYYLEGWLKKAAREFNTVLKLDPDNPKASLMLKKMVE